MQRPGELPEHSVLPGALVVFKVGIIAPSASGAQRSEGVDIPLTGDGILQSKRGAIAAFRSHLLLEPEEGFCAGCSCKFLLVFSMQRISLYLLE